MIILRYSTEVSPYIPLLKFDKASVLLLVEGKRQQRFKAYNKRLSLIVLPRHIMLRTLQVS